MLARPGFALPGALGFLTGILFCLLALDTGCTLGSFATNNNSNANNSNTNTNTNDNTNTNTNTNGNVSLGAVVNISGSHNASRSTNAIATNCLVDDAGNAYAAWEETDANGFDIQVKFASQPAGGSWTSPVTLSTGTTGDPVQQGSMRMHVSRTTGEVHVVWVQGTGATARVRASHNRGGSFVASFAVSTATGEPASGPGVRVDQNGTAHYLWTRLITPRRVMYKGMFFGALDPSESEVSARGARAADDAVLDPDGLVLIPGTGDQSLGVAYSALVAGQQQVFYTERSGGATGTFDTITDVSLEETGNHPAGTAAFSPRPVVNNAGDLVITFGATAANGVRNTRVNGRPRGSTFRTTSVSLTAASVGDSSRSTSPVDAANVNLLDTTGGLHLAWEDAPGAGDNALRHRYLVSPAADPSSGAIVAFATTTPFSGQHLVMSGLDGGDAFYVGFEQEDSLGVRDLFIRRRAAGAGANFDDVARLTTTSVDTRLRGFGVSSGGRAMALGDEGAIPFVFLGVREVDGSVIGPVDVSRSSGIASVGLALRVSASGRAHAFWLSTFNGSMRDLVYTQID